MHLSPHFTLSELTASSTAKVKGISNIPNTQQTLALALLCSNILEPLRLWHGRPILIGSGFRSPALNKAVGGVPNSQHLQGEAVDICIEGDLTRGRKLFDYILQNLDFDQLIWEHNAKGTYWIHVSYRSDGKNRHQVINNLLKK